MITFIAYTIKGLEQIASKEIKTISSAENLVIKDKSITFEIPEGKVDWDKLTELKTVDDIGLLIDQIHITNKTDHKELSNAITTINFGRAKRLVNKVRNFKTKQFSLTVSLPGFKNLKSLPFKDILAKDLATEKEWVYLPKDHTQFDIRIFKADSKTVFVSARLTSESLHKRNYKEFAKRGSLRPTIAAGLVYHAIEIFNNTYTPNRALTLVDTFCGSGTILAEAYLQGLEIKGSDIDTGSVEFTKRNLSNLDFQENEDTPLSELVTISHAGSTNWKDNQFDLVVSNLPWGSQVGVQSFTQLFTESIQELKRILKDTFVMVLLVKKPELCKRIINDVFEEINIDQFELSLVGQQPSVLVVTL